MSTPTHTTDNRAEGFEAQSLGAHYHPGRVYIETRRPTVMSQHHWHGHVELNLPYDDDVEYRINGRSCRLPAGHLGVFWAAVPHRLTAAHRCERMMIAYVPIQQFLVWPLDDAVFSDLIGGATLISDRPYPLGDDQLALLIDEFEQQDPGLAQLVGDELLMMLRRAGRYGWQRLLPPDATRTIPRRRGDPALDQVRVMLETIAQHYAAPLTLDVIAERAGLHPNYAMNRFKRVMGTSMKQYITRLRLNHAKALLAETRRPILDIALSVGFASNSRFYAAFKRYETTTPQQFRDEARGY